MIGLLGKKIGMIQVFGEDGKQIGATAIEVGPCPVLAVSEKSIQIGFEPAKENRLKKPLLGYFKKLNIAPVKIIKEVSREPDKEYKTGDLLKVDLFKPGEFVDVTGTSKGRGFQGGMKRWNWSGGPKTHGSTSKRRVGSIGSSATPSRVFKGHHMPGHMGSCKVTLQNLKIVKVDAENNLLLVQGAVPGSNNGYLMVKKAIKKKNSTVHS